MPDGPQLIEIIIQHLVETLLHGAVYDETNDTEQIAALRLEADKTLRAYALQVLHDALGNEQIPLVDTNRVPWTHEYEGYVQQDGTELLGGIWTVVFDPGTTAAELYEVYYTAANIDPTAERIYFSIGHQVGGAAVQDADTWSDAEILPQNCHTGWRGPWVIGGNDRVAALTGAINDCAVSIRARRVDIGA